MAWTVDSFANLFSEFWKVKIENGISAHRQPENEWSHRNTHENKKRPTDIQSRKEREKIDEFSRILYLNFVFGIEIFFQVNKSIFKFIYEISDNIIVHGVPYAPRESSLILFD